MAHYSGTFDSEIIRMKIDWIVEDKIALSGTIDDYNKLVDYNIDIVINARAEQHDDVYELSKRGIAYFWIPIGDYGAPRSDQIDTFIKLVDKHSDKKILVHCSVGRGRSPMLVACWLILYRHSTIKETMDYIISKRQVVELTENQLRKLKWYFRYKKDL